VSDEFVNLMMFKVSEIGPTVYINHYRVCGLNPVGQKPYIDINIRKKDLLNALGAPNDQH